MNLNTLNANVVETAQWDPILIEILTSRLDPEAIESC